MKIFLTIIACAFVCISITNADAQWIKTDGPDGGFVTGVWCNGSTFIAQTKTKNYRSSDNGDHWQPIDIGGTTNAVKFVVYDSVFGYASTNNTLFRSSDQGATWQALPTSNATNDISNLIATPKSLYSASDFGLFRSLDHGETWQLLIPDSSAQFGSGLAVNDSLIIFARSDVNHISTDNGATWSDSAWTFQVESLFSVGHVILGASFTESYRSDDSGRTWIITSDANKIGGIRQIARTDSVLFATSDLYTVFSSDTGRTWSYLKMNGFDVQGFNSITSGNGYILGSNAAGIIRSANDGAYWVRANNRILESGISTLWSDATTTLAGGDDGLSRTEDNGDHWTVIHDGIENHAVTAIISVGSDLFLSTYESGIFKSSDKGLTWTRTDTSAQPNAFSCMFSLGTNLLGGTQIGIYRSSDAGISWVPVDITKNIMTVTDFTQGESGVYATTLDSGLLVSTDAGLTWSKVDAAEVRRPMYAIATDGYYLYADRAREFSGMWDLMQIGPSNRSDPITLYFADQSGLYASSSTIGLLRSSDHGDTWRDVGAGLPVNQAGTMCRSGDVIVAGIRGSGVWRRSVSELSVDAQPTKPQSESISVSTDNNGTSLNVKYFAKRIGDAQLEIYDMLGRRILRSTFSATSEGWNQAHYPLPTGISGTFVCRISNGSSTVSSVFQVVR